VVRNAAEMRFILRSLLDNGVPFTLSTDGPEMLGSHLRDEVSMLLRTEMMSLDEVGRAIETAHGASFVDLAPISPEATAGVGADLDQLAPIGLEIEV